MKQYTWIERKRIHEKAKEKLGLKKQDEDEFMSECVVEVLSSGEASDPEEAISICQDLWDEGDNE